MERFSRILALAGCLWVIVSAIPHTMLAYFGSPGDIGLTVDYGGVVRAGPYAGRTIDFHALPFSERYVATPARPPIEKGVTHTIPFVNDESVRIKTSDFFGDPTPTRVDLTLRAIVTIALVVIAGLALWAYPTRRNVALFLFCIGANPIALNARLTPFPSATTWLSDVMVIDFLSSIALLGIVDFAIQISKPSKLTTFWEAALPCFGPFFCLMTMWPDFATQALGIPSETTNRVGYFFASILVAYGTVALGYTAVCTPRSLRGAPLIGTAIYGIGVGGYLFANVVMFTSILPPLAAPTIDALESLSFLLFTFVAGGFLIERIAAWSARERQTTITVAVDVIFAAAWDPIVKFLQNLEHRTALGPSDAALGAAFLIAGVLVNRPIDAFVQRRITSSDQAARERLDSAHHYLLEAQDNGAVDHALLLIAEVFDLTCVVVFRRDGTMFRPVAGRHLSRGSAHAATASRQSESHRKDAGRDRRRAKLPI